MELAPIALFTYNRPEHTSQTLQALSQNELASQSTIYIFSDGPKPNASPETQIHIEKTREVISQSYPFAKIHLILREKNMGLAKSVITGVTQIINKHQQIIVLEDDLLPAPHFLPFMNDALKLYQNEEKVASIHAYTYPVKHPLPHTFFLRGADCWGWATWKRSWDLLNTNASDLLHQIQSQGLEKTFNYNYQYPYTKMLQNQANQKISSWAILWYASMFLENKLTLYPALSLIQNIGADGHGTHVQPSTHFHTDFNKQRWEVNPIPMEESSIARAAFETYFHSIKEPLLSKMIHTFKKWLR